MTVGTATARRLRAADLSRPLVHSQDDITLLSGANVALAPERVASAAGRAVDPAGRGLPFLAFATPRGAGLCGVTGRATPEGIVITGTFGAPEALAVLGESLGSWLSNEDRFPEMPGIDLDGISSGAGGSAFADAVTEALPPLPGIPRAA